MVLRSQEDLCRSTSGYLAPARLWKLGRTEDEKLFDKRISSGSSEFVIDILVDSSGSQAIRQSQVAVQGYILSEALSFVEIPHRVVSYCTFWNHTIMHRFRDYDDEKEKNERIFEFRASGDNRDGLAVKAAYDTLLNRPENHKILILLGDGKPCDISVRRPGIRRPADYTGEKAVKDTAFEVRRARTLGISALGIFAGNYEDTAAEKRIFGKDFAYIRDIRNFPVLQAPICADNWKKSRKGVIKMSVFADCQDERNKKNDSGNRLPGMYGRRRTGSVLKGRHNGRRKHLHRMRICHSGGRKSEGVFGRIGSTWLFLEKCAGGEPGSQYSANLIESTDGLRYNNTEVIMLSMCLGMQVINDELQDIVYERRLKEKAGDLLVNVRMITLQGNHSLSPKYDIGI